MPLVLARTDGEVIRIDAKGSLLDSIVPRGIDVDSICGGKGRCGKCIVKVLRGQCSPPTRSEIDVLGTDALNQGYRLACQTFPKGEVELRIFSRGTKKKILTSAKNVLLDLDPLVKVDTFALVQPSITDQKDDLERLMSSAGATAIDHVLLGKMPGILRQSNWHVDVIMFEKEIVDVLHAGGAAPLGAAVDLGTTTIVLYLTDLRSGNLVQVQADYNMQAAHGEDVISRVSYSAENEQNLKRLQELAVSTINKLIERSVLESGVRREQVCDIVVAGNTIMLSLLLGANPKYIASAPYTPPFLKGMRVKAADLGLNSNKAAYLRTLPCISGYVGADIVADILVSGMVGDEGPVMLIDVGTNAEVVLKSSEERMSTTSCAAGPAFEGGELSSGIRAMAGAIEEVMIDPDDFTVYWRAIEGAAPKGICGSGLVDALAWMLFTGILEKSGRIAKKETMECVRVVNGEAALVLAADENGRLITVTQSDIRKAQLAKAAIYVGCETLVKKEGIRFSDLKRIYLAGAFGNYIDQVSGMSIGMFPDIELTRFENIGNGSAAGARMVLLSKKADEEAMRVARRLLSIDMNLESDFQERFVRATLYPHHDEDLFENVWRGIRRRRGIRPLPSELR